MVCNWDTGHTGSINDCQLDYYGRKLATTSNDGSIKIWDLTQTDPAPTFLAKLDGHEAPVWQVAWAHPKFAGILASCSYDRSVIIWKQISEGQWVMAYRDDNHKASVNSIAWAPFEYGLVLAAASSDGTVSIIQWINADNWTRSSFQAHGLGVQAVAWSSAPVMEPTNAQIPLDTSRLITGGLDNAVRFWSYSGEKGNYVQDNSEQHAHEDWVQDVIFRPNDGISNLAASCSQDKTILIWGMDPNTAMWKPTKKVQLADKVWRLSFSTTGSMLLASHGENTSTILKENLSGEWEIVEDVDNNTGSFAQ